MVMVSHVQPPWRARGPGSLVLITLRAYRYTRSITLRPYRYKGWRASTCVLTPWHALHSQPCKVSRLRRLSTTSQRRPLIGWWQSAQAVNVTGTESGWEPCGTSAPAGRQTVLQLQQLAQARGRPPHQAAPANRCVAGWSAAAPPDLLMAQPVFHTSNHEVPDYLGRS
jgi:hypothetical protein